MDKYEYKLKLEQLKNLVAGEDYETAAQIADTINWKKVRNANTLCMVAKIYENTENYDECIELLSLAYEHASSSRSIVSKLVEVAIRSNNIEVAEEYYNEFIEISPKDSRRYIFAYQIGCLKNSPIENQIAILEELKDREYTEAWSYELAALYGQAGMRDKCVAACDELIIWFGDGEYVEKALDLKRQFQPLTPAQEKKYQTLRGKRGLVDVEVPRKTEVKISDNGLPEVEVSVSASKFNTINLQEELAKNMRQIMEATEKETVADTMDNIKKMVNDIPYLSGEQEAGADPIYNPERINEEVDESLKADFREKMRVSNLQEDSDGQISMNIPQDTEKEKQIEGQISIEDVLAEWEKTKRAAEEAIAAAEQKKLEMAKNDALKEAGDIMERLKTLIPILSEDQNDGLLPQNDTIAAAITAEARAEEEQIAEEYEPVVIAPEGLKEAASDGVESLDEDSMEAEEPVSEPTMVLPDIKAQTEEASTSEDEELDKLLESVTKGMVADANLDAPADGADAEIPSTEPAVETAEVSEVVEEEEAEEEPAVFEESEVIDETPEVIAEPEVVDETPEVIAEPEEADETPEAIAEPEEADETPEAIAEPEEADEAPEVIPEPEEMPQPPVSESPVTENTVDDIDELYGRDVVEPVQFDGTLTDEQRELFSYFLPVPGMEEQICKVLSSAPAKICNAITSLQGNILVIGEEGSGKTVFATSLIKAIQQLTGKEDTKIGKISAASLNHRDFATLIPKLDGGFLIIDKAGDLSAETARRMSRLMDGNTRGLVILLEDNSAGIRKALKLDYGFAKKFTEKVSIPIFTIDELVAFGKSYAEEMECFIDEMGVLALYNRINNIQKLEHATTLAEVKDIVDEAIESAESGGFRKLFSKKYNENDFLILREKDFEGK